MQKKFAYGYDTLSKYGRKFHHVEVSVRRDTGITFPRHCRDVVRAVDGIRYTRAESWWNGETA